MAGRVISDVVFAGGVPVPDSQAVQVAAYKASRFTVTPALGTAPPPGLPDAGPVVAGSGFGGVGAFILACPTSEDYWVHAVISTDVWEFYPATAAGATGPAGATGATGATGPPGPAEQGFTYTQGVPAAVWTIAHNLGGHPTVTVVDSAGSVVIGDVHYVDGNNLTITFAAAFAGTAFLN